tara:strand:+ start:139 stop:783 length:645 start_codon:yes stop_codon:yes gene_type:complete
MSEIASEYILQIVERLEVTDPSAGVNYNEYIRGLYNWRDLYSGAKTYYTNDVVEYKGSQYIRVSQTPGSQIPTDIAWKILPGTSKKDLQSVTLINNVTTIATWTDLAGMTLTTKDLGGPGTYNIYFSAVGVTPNNNTTTISYKLQRNGVDVPNQQNDLRQYGLENSVANIICVLSAISSGDVFKIQWQRTGAGGTCNCDYRTLIIDGLLSSNII